jgi:hypothetical protein
MNLRPSIHGIANASTKCSCGKPKSVSKQWCDECWEKIPPKAARTYQQRAASLARSTLACQRYINHSRADKVTASSG